MTVPINSYITIVKINIKIEFNDICFIYFNIKSIDLQHFGFIIIEKGCAERRASVKAKSK